MKNAPSIGTNGFFANFPSGKALGLTALFIFVLTAWFSCKKEGSTPDFAPLTIGMAKNIFASTGIGDALAFNRTEEGEGEPDCDGGCGGGQIQISLDWAHASEYQVAAYGLSLVEVPVAHSNLSTFGHDEGGGQSGSSTSVADEHVCNVLFLQDSNGVTKVRILKILGTPDYMANNSISSNSFQSLDQDFEGWVGYYDLRDSLAESYLISEGTVYETGFSNDTGHIVGAADRAGWCFTGQYQEIVCTGKIPGHTWEERTECQCKGKLINGCNPPNRVPIMEPCVVAISPTVWKVNGDVHLPPPVIVGGTGLIVGGATSSGAWSFFHFFTEHYAMTHNGEQLLNDEETEAIAQACYADLAASSSTITFDDFESCVDEQMACNCSGNLFEERIIDTHYPYGVTPSIDVYGQISDKKCKTGDSNGSARLSGGTLPAGMTWDIAQNSSHLTKKKRVPGQPCKWKVEYRHYLDVFYFQWNPFSEPVPVPGNPFTTDKRIEYMID